jgi:hypothetical protein
MKETDRLFSDTLEGHVTSPSSGLWERVEFQLPRPTHATTWMRWAAVLVPALVAAGLWMNTRPETSQPVATQTIAPALQPVESVGQKAVTEPAPIAQTSPRKKATPKVRIATAPIAEATPASAVEETVALDEMAIEPIVLEEEVAVVAESPKPLVLVYTLETIVTEAPDGADRNTLDRVVDFARTVKHSDPIGDIRGLKDELFALDLRKKQPKKN